MYPPNDDRCPLCDFERRYRRLSGVKERMPLLREGSPEREGLQMWAFKETTELLEYAYSISRLIHATLPFDAEEEGFGGEEEEEDDDDDGEGVGGRP